MIASRRVRQWLVNLTRPSVWAVRLYRISNACYHRGYPALPIIIDGISRVLTAIEIEHAAEIGRGFVIIHGAGLVIGGGAVIGSNCVVLQNVTIGNRSLEDLGRSNDRTMPILGNGVVVYAGAVLAGPITIGDRAVIGANAVVLQDVPAGHVAVGNPATIRPARSNVAG